MTLFAIGVLCWGAGIIGLVVESRHQRALRQRTASAFDRGLLVATGNAPGVLAITPGTTGLVDTAVFGALDTDRLFFLRRTVPGYLPFYPAGQILPGPSGNRYELRIGWGRLAFEFGMAGFLVTAATLVRPMAGTPLMIGGLLVLEFSARVVRERRFAQRATFQVLQHLRTAA